MRYNIHSTTIVRKVFELKNNYFKRIMKNSCVYFTVISVILLTIQLIFGEQSDYTTVTPWRFILIYPYSCLISAARELMKYDKLSYPIRVIFHYFAVIWGFFFLMYLPASMKASGSTLLVALSLLTMLYIFSFIAYKLISGVFKSKSNKRKQYDSIFSGENRGVKK